MNLKVTSNATPNYSMTMKKKVQTLQDVTAFAQDALGNFAHFFEAQLCLKL